MTLADTDWPAAWCTVPLWFLFHRIKDVEHPGEEMLSTYRDHGVVKKDERDDNFNKTAEDRSIYQLVDKGWLVVNRMKAWQGSLGVSPYRGIVSGHYICFAPRHAEDARFLNHLLRSDIYRTELARLSRGVRPNQLEIDNDLLRVLPVHLPSVDTQRSIADFLHTETARIDLLSAKYELAGQLSTERWGALTGRLLSSACSKHGTVPLKRVTACLDALRVPLSSEERDSRQGPYPYFGASNVVDHVDDYLFDEELVLLGEDGAQLLDPSFAVSQVVRGKCWVNNHAHVLRPAGFDAELLSFHLNTFDRIPFISGSTRPKITQDDMGLIPVPHVGPDEQRRLRAEISSAWETVLRLRTSIDGQIRLLVERKQALITAAVTGQLDVAREIAEEAS